MANEFEPDFNLVRELIPGLNPEVVPTATSDGTGLRAYIREEMRKEVAGKRSPISMDYYFPHGMPPAPIRLFGQHPDFETIVDQDLLNEGKYPHQIPEINLHIRENSLTLARGISLNHDKPVSLNAFVYDTANPSSSPLPVAGKVKEENVLVVDLLKDNAGASQVLVLCVDRIPIASVGYHDTRQDTSSPLVPTLTVTFSPDLFFNDQLQPAVA